MNQLVRYIIFGAIFSVILGCTTKSNTYYNRQFKMIPTMYNVLYNGNLALEDGKKEIQEKFQENYLELLPIEPVAISDEIKLNGQENPHFDRAEEKAIKAIQKHSMVFDGRQRNRKIDDAYMLLGQSRYYNERFIPALQAFDHLLINYGETNRRGEAAVWREKTNIQLGRERLAIMNLEKFLQTETKIKKEDLSGIQATMAQAFIRLKNYENAAQMLKNAGSLTRNKPLRGRYYFITGQLYELLQKPDSAVVYFQKVIDLNRKIPRKLWIEAQGGKARNANFSAVEEQEFLVFLQKMARQYEHKDFLDVLYFQQGTILKKRKNSKQAIELFVKSLKNNKENNPLKEKSHENLAELYLLNKDYVKAHSHYDSTLVFVPENTLEHLFLRRKRDNLTEVAKLETSVRQIDSVLSIVKMSESERENFFQKYIDSLHKKSVENAPKITNFGRESKIKIQPQDEKLFYFNNPSAIAYGKQTFVKQYGDRPLVDNWRYSSLVLNRESIENETDSISKVSKLSPKTFLDKLPKESEIPQLIQKRNNELYDLAVIYFEKFSDVKSAEDKANTLISNNPSEELRLKTSYLLYKIFDSKDDAQKNIHKEMILKDFPTSQIAKILSGESQTNIQELNLKYKELQELFENQKFVEIISTIDAYQSQYLLSPTAPDWELLRAKAKGRLEGIKIYRKDLEKIKEKYPNTHQANEIDEILSVLSSEEKAPEFEPDQKASSWKIIYPELTETELSTLKNLLEENGLAYIKTTEDIYDASEKWVVLHGFFDKAQAQMFIEKINSDKKNRISQELFVISAENYSIIQLYKNKNQYK